MEPSSASQITQELFEKFSLSQADIRAAHLGAVYADLTTIDTASDFSSIEDLLPSDSASTKHYGPALGVIIETRPHPALASVIENVINTCNIPVQLFHGNENIEFITSSLVSQYSESGQLSLTKLETNFLDAKQYNALLLDTRFWECVNGREKILIFQTDSLCCPESKYCLDDFTEFDYIGSRWARPRPVGLTIDGGSGGFSLRDWARMVECLERFPPVAWGGGEDGYFAFHLAVMGARVANMNEAAGFSTQDEFSQRSFAAHGIQHLKAEHRAAFFDYCPEAAKIFPDVYQTLSNPTELA